MKTKPTPGRPTKDALASWQDQLDEIVPSADPAGGNLGLEMGPDGCEPECSDGWRDAQSRADEAERSLTGTGDGPLTQGVNEHPITLHPHDIDALRHGRLWVHESWRVSSCGGAGIGHPWCVIVYRDGEYRIAHPPPEEAGEVKRYRELSRDGWLSAFHMPRWASRFTLRAEVAR